MNKKQKKLLIRICISLALYATGLLLQSKTTPLILLIPYFVAGWDVLYKAIRHLFGGRLFDENFLMAVATVGALGLGEFPEAVFVMVFYQVGELFQSYAVGKSRDSIAGLMELAPETAWVERDGVLYEVVPEEIEVGDLLAVKPGEKIPADGIVESGTSSLNTAALTGEAMPRDVQPGDEVISGCINLKGLLKIRATKEFSDSTVSKILELVENAASSKAKTEQFITRFARYYTPAVVFLAVVLAVLPPVAGMGAWTDWLRRALTFLMVSCPCALVISVPMSFFGGIGRASKQGILVKGSNYMEVLSKAKTVIFDKTGTLTQGSFSVTEVFPQGIDKEELVRLAAMAESVSDHPIAQSLRQAYGKEIPQGAVGEAKEIPGCGIQAEIEGKRILAGNRRLMEQNGVTYPSYSQGSGTQVLVAADGVFLGVILISDRVKEDGARAVSALKELGVSRLVMLTGDHQSAALETAKQVGISEVHGELLPQDKVAMTQSILEEQTEGSVLFVGDGMNDAPVLAMADAGIAMGALGSDAAIEAADIVLMDDKPSRLAQGVRIAKKTMRVVWQNIVFALAVKLTVLVLSAFGLANMWEAVIADVGVSVLAVCNAMRTLYGKN
ncbi:MAG: heavy metal translocating P-type ATPase [Clostridia bacterium]|nr:heavy metal translocating P-type ATPase [Clostridia bacterium]